MASKKLVSVDIEADGPCPGLYSMISLGAVIVEDGLERRFYGEFKPITNKWIPEALDVSGFTRVQCMDFPNAEETLHKFKEWLAIECPNGCIFIADNPGFDFAFVNYYFINFFDKNPFGWSARRIGDLFCGVMKDGWYQWKKHRKTKHSHNALDDALGNAEAILYLRDELGVKLPK